MVVFTLASTFNVFEAVPIGLQKMEYNNFVQLFVAGLFTVLSILLFKRRWGPCRIDGDPGDHFSIANFVTIYLHHQGYSYIEPIAKIIYLQSSERNDQFRS